MFIPQVLQAQFIVPSIEPLVGLNYYRRINFPETNYANSYVQKRGIVAYYGIRGRCMFGNRLAISNSFGYRSVSFAEDYFLAASIQTYLHRNYKTGFSVFCETGIELQELGGVAMPFYIGTTQYFGETVCFNFRFRMPLFIDALRFESADLIETGLEMSLQFDLRRRRTPELTRFGNPFILI